MSVVRARASCPICSSEEEIWFYKGKVEPIPNIQCITCTTLYDPASFVTCFIELYQNVTVSSSTIHF
jgi:hypothetical protein